MPRRCHAAARYKIRHATLPAAFASASATKLLEDTLRLLLHITYIIAAAPSRSPSSAITEDVAMPQHDDEMMPPQSERKRRGRDAQMRGRGSARFMRDQMRVRAHAASHDSIASAAMTR